MVKVSNIIWLSKEILEAEVTISDGKFDLVCFAHPFLMQEGEQFIEIIDAFEVGNVIKLDYPSLKAERMNNSFSYQIEGQLVDKDKGLVKLGEILIGIDDRFIPNDIETGDYISFVCDRLDI
jgi:hypothetical protein